MPSHPSAPSDGSDWRAIIADANAAALQRRLDGASDLDLEFAIATRDFAAGLVTADPVLAHAVSECLLRAARRSGHSAKPDRREGILAVAWRSRAETAAYVGRPKEARAAYETASLHATRSGDDSLLGQILVGRIGLLASLGSAPAAARLVPKAERLLRGAGDLNYLARLHMNLGNAACHREEFETACLEFEEAAQFFEAIGEQGPARVGLEMNQGIAYTELSRVAEARRVFLNVEHRSRELGLPHFVAQAQFNRGFLEGYFGDYRTALQLLEDAEAAFHEEGATELTAGTALARAEIYLDLGMGQEASELAHEATRAYEQEEMSLDAALGRFAEARSLALLGNLEEAAKLFAVLGEFYRHQKIRPRRALVQLQLAAVLLAQGDLGSSRKVAGRALTALERLRIGVGVARARILIAEVELRRGDTAAAEVMLEPALTGAENLPIGERVGVWHLAGRVATMAGERSAARHRLDRAVRAVEAQRRLIPGVELRARAFESHARVYRDRVEHAISGRQLNFESLFGLVESARARAFRERGLVLSGAGPVLRTEPAVSPAMESLRARLGSLVRRMERAQYDADGPEPQGSRELRHEILGLERKIMTELRGQAVRAAGRLGAEEADRDWSGAANPAEVEAALAPGEQMVEYFVLSDRILALVLGDSGRRAIVLDTAPAAVRAIIQSFHAQLDTLALTADRHPPNLPFLRRAADSLLARLYDALLRPLELSGARRLVLVPHGFLHRVPFECLRTPTGYLLDQCVIRRSPTADFLLRKPRLQGHAGPQEVVVSGLIEGGPASVAPELEAVCRALGSQPTRVMRDPTASELLSAFGSARCIHLSTHGVFRADNPMFSRLSTQGGALFLVDVLDRKIDADLVVLSACNTGRVFAGEGDDLSGVAHGFLAAGARRLVASTWRVHDRATQDWMESFYRELRPEGDESLEFGADPGPALARASASTRDRWDHPFYWGAFCLHG